MPDTINHHVLLGMAPANRPRTPVLKMLEEISLIELPCSVRLVMILVRKTSKGVVTNAATAPAVPLVMNEPVAVETLNRDLRSSWIPKRRAKKGQSRAAVAQNPL